MALPIIQSLWVGDPLSNLEKLCIRSFIDNGHEFHLYTYGDVGDTVGAVVKDGNEIVPAAELFGSKAKQRYSNLSDYFRYALLYKLGGWWVDMDTVCLKPFDFAEKIAFIKYNNSPLRFPQGHPLMKTMRDYCRERLAKTHKRFHHGSLGGPKYFLRQVSDMNLEHLAIPYMRVDLNMRGLAEAFGDSYCDGLHFSANAHAVHLGNTELTKVSLNKYACYDSTSLFEQLKVKHSIANSPDAKRITSDEVRRLVDAVKMRRVQKNKQRKLRGKIWVAAALIFATALAVCVVAG